MITINDHYYFELKGINNRSRIPLPCDKYQLNNSATTKIP